MSMRGSIEIVMSSRCQDDDRRLRGVLIILIGVALIAGSIATLTLPEQLAGTNMPQ